MSDTITTQQHLDRAYELENQGLLQEALSECDRAIQTDPELAEAYNLQGIILDQLGNTEDAIAAYKRAIQLQPDFEEAIQNSHEAQEDTDAPELEVDRKEAFRTALIGALGFGISFTIANLVQGLVSVQSIMSAMVGNNVFSRIFSFGLTLLFSSIVYAIGVGAGTAIFVKAIQAGKRNTLVMANALGFGITYLIVGIVTQFLFSVFNVVGFFSSIFFAFNVRWNLAFQGSLLVYFLV